MVFQVAAVDITEVGADVRGDRHHGEAEIRKLFKNRKKIQNVGMKASTKILTDQLCSPVTIVFLPLVKQ